MIIFPSAKHVIKKHLPIVEGIVREYVNYPIPFKMIYKRENGLKHFSIILPKEYSYYNKSRNIELIKIILSEKKAIIIGVYNWDLDYRNILPELITIIDDQIKDNLCWSKVSLGNLPINFVRKYHKKIEWIKVYKESLYGGIPISDDIINEFHYKLSWKVISKQKLSSKILHDFQDKIIWNLYLQHNDLDLNMIKQNIPFSTFRSFILGN